MAERPRNVLICSCEDTMPLDGEAVARVCRGANVIEGRQLCRAELERFRKLAAGGAPLTVACTQEAPLFEEVAGEIEGAATLSFVNIRETAGWSKDAKAAGPKMAALIAAAAEPVPEIAFVPLDQRRRDADLRQGRTGDRSRQTAEGSSRRHRADQAARRPGAAAGDRFPGGEGQHPAGQGLSRRLRADRRRLCRARPVLARRTRFRAGAQRRDLALRHRARPLRRRRRCSRPPICATAICAPIRAIRPPCCARCSRRAISSAPSTSRATSTFTADLCAHSRSKIVGCRRCLDLCPTGAIAPNGDHVAIDRADLRRLRPMRRRLPDRRRGLCAAAVRRAAAQIAHAACAPTARPAARRRWCCSTTPSTAAN